jgi:hypothetical protein
VILESDDKAPQQFIAPLDMDEEVKEKFVHSIRKNSQNLDSTPPQEPSEKQFSGICVDHLISLFKIMRKFALSRLPIWVTTTIFPVEDEMNYEEFNDIESRLCFYRGWTEFSKHFVQITEVDYEVQDKKMISFVQFKDSVIVTAHKECEVYESFTNDLPAPYDQWKITGKATSWKSVSADELPISVSPTSVRIIHQKSFIKGAWKINIMKIWKASNTVEAESLQLGGSKSASFSVEIELSKPWELMEKRGSIDVAIASSMMERIFYCLDSIKG